VVTLLAPETHAGGKRVPFADLAAQEAAVAPEVLEAVAEVARDARFILGTRVEAFEAWLAAACGAVHAVGVASGSDALELSLRALDVGAGDAVVTPAFSFIAAAEAIVLAGARPVFCDVDALTLNASERSVTEAVARARRDGLRVRAIMPVDLFGRCAPSARLRALAEGEGAALVRDAAQAIGARDDEGRPAGSGGDAGCFSFFPSKNLGAWGDGGAVVTSRGDVAARVRRLRAHGAVSPYVHAEVGRNSRLDALQAAVLLAKTRRLEGWRVARARIAARYQAELTGTSLTLPALAPPPEEHAWHAYVVRSARRDALAAALAEQGVETRVYYPVPLHRQACFASLGEPALPVSEAACETALALPIFTAMTDDQQARVIDAVRRFFR
jgi:dTDP-4-amino-4,6-dideoxygalactose transaminase